MQHPSWHSWTIKRDNSMQIYRTAEQSVGFGPELCQNSSALHGGRGAAGMQASKRLQRCCASHPSSQGFSFCSSSENNLAQNSLWGKRKHRLQGSPPVQSLLMCGNEILTAAAADCIYGFRLTRVKNVNLSWFKWSKCVFCDKCSCHSLSSAQLSCWPTVQPQVSTELNFYEL